MTEIKCYCGHTTTCDCAPLQKQTAVEWLVEQVSRIEKIAGIDVFFIHKNYLEIYPISMYALGQCHFDYWIPYRAVNNGIDVCFIEQNIAFHKNHNTQYNHDSWIQTGRYFMWENNLYQFHPTQGIGQMSTFVVDCAYKHQENLKNKKEKKQKKRRNF